MQGDCESYLEPRAAANFIGVGHSTLAKWRAKGQGPRWYKIAGRVRYDVADLKAWLQSERARSQRPAQPEHPGT